MEMFFNGQESNNGNNWFDCESIENEECSNVDLTFRFGKDDDYYEKIFRSTNGLVMPGGIASFRYSGIS